ncbi:MAG: radical SAM protein [Elusimicrobiota bacterium]|nr:radical SAM protein [Elusimicrobiota bacterium]
MDLSLIYRKLLNAHSLLPRLFGSPSALPLLNISIEVTHRCNLRCAMCFQAKRVDAAGEMTTAEIIKIIDDLPPWTITTLTGGEPFMRSDFRAILAHALKKRKCNILTNAELITDADIEMFVEKGLTLIGISIDGLAATHDRIRNKKGLFDKASAVIKKISVLKKSKGARFPLVDIKTVILKENLGELHAISELADDLNADFFSLSLPKLSDRQFNEPYYENLERDLFAHAPLRPEHIGEEGLKTLRGQLDLIAGNSGPAKLRFYPYNMLESEAAEKYYSGGLTAADFEPCGVPWSLACVSPYGDLFPCLSYRAGNVRQKPLAQIWNGENFRAFRARLGKKKLDPCCMGCCYSVYRDQK